MIHMSEKTRDKIVVFLIAVLGIYQAVGYYRDPPADPSIPGHQFYHSVIVYLIIWGYVRLLKWKDKWKIFNYFLLNIVAFNGSYVATMFIIQFFRSS